MFDVSHPAGKLHEKHTVKGSHEFPGRPAARHPPAVREAEMLEMVLKQVAAVGLDLSGLTVVLGAATGYQAVAAGAAALAGAKRVLALVREAKRPPTAIGAATSTMAFADY